MTKTIETSIEIYGQTFNLRTEPEEEKNLQRVAVEVNEFLRELACKGNVPLHRLALMAAFQYAYQLDIAKKRHASSPDTSRKVSQKIEDIIGKLQDALDQE